MLSRLFALIILIATLYVLAVFIAPAAADQYGKKEWNDAIRSLKSQTESYTGSSTSLYDGIKSQATGIIEESKSTIDNAQKVIDTKTTQVKETAESVQKAVDAVEKAKNDIQKLTGTSGSTAQ